MVKFTIIIPVFNTEKYLEKCIDSVIRQKFDDYEIIIVNDKSNDNSKIICEKYKSMYTNINFIDKRENEGLSEARNSALRIAKGEYIIFLDSDDWLIEGSLLDVNNIILNKYRPDIIINRVSFYYEKDNIYNDCNYEFDLDFLDKASSVDVFDYCFKKNDIVYAPWVFIIRRNFLEENHLFFKKGLLHEDEEWSPKVILNSKDIAFNNTCFYCYRVNRNGSITQSLNIKREFDKLKIIDLLIEESNNQKYNDKQRLRFKERCSSLYIGVLKNIYDYKKINIYDYNNIVKTLKEKRYVLLFNREVKYKIIYILTSVIGINAVSFIMKRLKNYY